VVMRRPFDVQLIGTNLSSKPGVKRMFAEHSGSGQRAIRCRGTAFHLA
jgi:hypothetical protein